MTGRLVLAKHSQPASIETSLRFFAKHGHAALGEPRPLLIPPKQLLTASAHLRRADVRIFQVGALDKALRGVNADKGPLQVRPERR